MLVLLLIDCYVEVTVGLTPLECASHPCYELSQCVQAYPEVLNHKSRERHFQTEDMALLLEWKTLNNPLKRWGLLSSLNPWGAGLPSHTIFSSFPNTPLRLVWGEVALDTLSPRSVLESSTKLAFASRASFFLPLKGLVWTLLITELSVGVYTNLGESGSQRALAVALAGKRSVIHHWRGQRLGLGTVLFLLPGPSCGISTLTSLYL